MTKIRVVTIGNDLERMGTKYIRLSDLRLWLDLFLWQAAYPTLNLPHRKSCLLQSRVPTVEEILYWILEDQAFAFQVLECLGIMEREMGTAHKVMKLQLERGRVQDNPIFFFCAIILIDEVAKHAEKFMLTDDVQECLKSFPRVYIQ